MAKRRVYIVIEETDDPSGKGFEVFLEGLSPGADKFTPEEQLHMLKTVDFWGLRLFQICTGVMGVMMDTGVVKTLRTK